MIGQDMFEEFVYPNLQKFCEDIDRTIYHLDGPGELKHLPKILELDQLRAVQWIPGAGNPSIENYREIHRSIESTGKYIELPVYEPDQMLQVAGYVDNPACLHTMMIRCTAKEKKKYLYYLREQGVI